MYFQFLWFLKYQPTLWHANVADRNGNNPKRNKNAKIQIQEKEKEAANKGKKSKPTKALNTAKHADA